MTANKIVKIVVCKCPVLVILLHLAPVPREEVHLCRDFVCEAKLIFQQRYFALGADTLSNSDLLGVLFPVLLCLWTLLKVYAEIFAVGLMVAILVFNRRPEVKVQGYLATG